MWVSYLVLILPLSLLRVLVLSGLLVRWPGGIGLGFGEERHGFRRLGSVLGSGHGGGRVLELELLFAHVTLHFCLANLRHSTVSPRSRGAGRGGGGMGTCWARQAIWVSIQTTPKADRASSQSWPK